MPGDLARNPQECHRTAPSNPWTMRGLLLELRCTVPELPGTVYAYQLDSAADYETAWQNFNHVVGFPSRPRGKGVPAKRYQRGNRYVGQRAPPGQPPGDGVRDADAKPRQYRPRIRLGLADLRRVRPGAGRSWFLVRCIAFLVDRSVRAQAGEPPE